MNNIKKIDIKKLHLNKEKEILSLNTRDKNSMISSGVEQEINFSFRKYDEDVINKSTLEIKTIGSLYYREITYLDDNKDVIRRFASFDKEREQNLNNRMLYKGSMNFLSNTELKLKNLINLKNNENELRNHFYNMIDTFEVTNEIKNIFKLYFVDSDFINNLPFLYFNEEKNKKEWIIPNYDSNEDLVYDYETEIPYTVKMFKTLLTPTKNNSKHFSYFILNKKGIINYQKQSDNNILIETTYDFDDKFYFINTKNQTNKSLFFDDNVIGLNKNNTTEESKKFFEEEEINNISYNLFSPQISSLNVEQTLEVLKKSSSNKTIDEIKTALTNYSKPILLSDESLDCYENKFNVFYYVDDEVSYKDLKRNLNRITINDKNIKFYKLPIKENTLINTEVIKDYKNEEYYIIKNDNTEFFLCKDNGIVEAKPKEKNTNIYKMFNNKEYIESSLFCLNGKYQNSSLIIDLKEELEWKIDDEQSYSSDGIGKSFIHNKNNKLFFINNYDKTFELISITKTFDEFDEKLIDILNFGNKRQSILLFKTDNEIIQLPLLNDKKKYITTPKDKEGNFHIKTKIPLLNNARNLKFVHNEIAKFYDINEQNELIMEVGAKDKEDGEYEFLDVDYVFKNDFYKPLVEQFERLKKASYQMNNNTLEKETNLYLNGEIESLGMYRDYENFLLNLKLNGVEYSKESSLSFLNNIALFKKLDEITFNLKKDENNTIFEFINKKDGNNLKYYLIKNNEKDIELSYYFKNDNGSTEILNLIKKNKILSSKYNKKINKKLYFSKDRTFIVNKFNGVDNIEIDYKKTLENKQSIINNENSLNYNTNFLMEIVIDKNLNFKNIKNIEQEKNILENLHKYDVF